MRLVKQGGHRLFTQDPETARVVSEMLSDIERHGLDAVRNYSRRFDDWAPERFALSERETQAAIDCASASFHSIRTTRIMSETWPSH